MVSFWQKKVKRGKENKKHESEFKKGYWDCSLHGGVQRKYAADGILRTGLCE